MRRYVEYKKDSTLESINRKLETDVTVIPLPVRLPSTSTEVDLMQTNFHIRAYIPYKQHKHTLINGTVDLQQLC